MSAERDLNSINVAAGNAATAGDFAAAVALLRQALDRQTATLGPDHPDLATTLNNLALMLEQVGDTDEAGRSYRRAYAIALAALGPDDPAVGVSHANLAAFYRAHGSSGDEVAGSMLAGLDDFPSVDEELGTVTPATPLPAQVLPPPPPPSPVSAASPNTPPTTPRPAPPPARAAARIEGRTAPSRRRSRAAVVGAAVILLGAAGWWALPSSRTVGQTNQATETAPARPADVAATTPATESVPPDGASAPAAPAARFDSGPVKEAVPPAASPKARATGNDAATRSAPDSKAAPAASATGTRVVEARLCGALSQRGAWRCQPLGNERRGGAVYFYTRVASTANEVVRHRWTRNGSVVRVVDLRIRANPKEGFRTYSRQTGRALESGDWQVALLDRAGAVLQEEAFVIR